MHCVWNFFLQQEKNKIGGRTWPGCSSRKSKLLYFPEEIPQPRVPWLGTRELLFFHNDSAFRPDEPYACVSSRTAFRRGPETALLLVDLF